MTENRRKNRPDGTVTLAELAEHLSLTKGTVSAVLNDSPYAKSIPQHTKDRILAAAAELHYQPNFFARTLRKKRTFTVGVISEEIGDPYGSMVISGIESALSQHKYFFLTVIHRHDPKLLQQYYDILHSRSVEGIITVDTILKDSPVLPSAAVAGHIPLPGVTNIVLDHDKAAEMALGHLVQLGHRNIAVIRGQSWSSDSAERWRAICDVASRLGVEIRGELTTQLVEQDYSSLPGYRAAKELLSRKQPFTALFAYNDMTAIGAIRAMREEGLRVPNDISVVGFDDIRESAYHSPSITTVRQPLRKMGEIAAQTVVARIEGNEDYPGTIAIEPEFVVRESTGPAPRRRSKASRRRK